jgi:hypothetical protein
MFFNILAPMARLGTYFTNKLYNCEENLCEERVFLDFQLWKKKCAPCGLIDSRLSPISGI